MSRNSFAYFNLSPLPSPLTSNSLHHLVDLGWGLVFILQGFFKLALLQVLEDWPQAPALMPQRAACREYVASSLSGYSCFECVQENPVKFKTSFRPKLIFDLRVWTWRYELLALCVQQESWGNMVYLLCWPAWCWMAWSLAPVSSWISPILRTALLPRRSSWLLVHCPRVKICSSTASTCTAPQGFLLDLLE